MPRKRLQNPPFSSSNPSGVSIPRPETGGRIGLHGWFEALVFAFVLAMFVRTYLFELFKVPTESMIPTIIAGEVAEINWDDDAHPDLAVWHPGNAISIFRWDKDRYIDLGPLVVPEARLKEWIARGLFTHEYDRILVNKFTYWFRHPRRGDIIVFKVPPAIWDPLKPFYIKRTVALPRESVTFRPDGKLLDADGAEVETPDFFRTQHYQFSAEMREPAFRRFHYVEYGPAIGSSAQILGVNLPPDMVYVLGDNTRSSLDSRYWGGVELNRLKGRAFFRYWPLSKLSFLN